MDLNLETLHHVSKYTDPPSCASRYLNEQGTVSSTAASSPLTKTIVLLKSEL